MVVAPIVRRVKPLRLVRILLGRFFALVPRRWRFTVARYVAVVGAPVAWLFAPPDWRLLSNGTNIAMWAVIRAMNRDEIEFDYDIDVEGADIVDEARRRGRGLLLISGHFRMNITIGRWFAARGWRFHAVRADPEESLYIPGTREKLPYFLRTPNVLVKIRNALAAGDMVYVAAESSEPLGHGFTIGGMHISDAAPQLAEKWGTTLAYMSTWADRRGRLHATITRGTAGDLRAMFETWLSATPSRRGTS